MTLSRDELYQRLDLRLDDPSIATVQDIEIWQEIGQDRALLVMDLSGFTRLTRTRGILHFLSVYRRAIRIVVPTITGLGGRVVKREADNVIAVFMTASSALEAAKSMVAQTLELDAALDEDSRVYPCIGLGFGKILELTDDVFGDEVNLAFKLGEDVAGRREILLTTPFMTSIIATGLTPPADPFDIELGGVHVPYFRLRNDP